MFLTVTKPNARLLIIF